MSDLASFGGPPAVNWDGVGLWPFYGQETEEKVIRRIRDGKLGASSVDPDITAFEIEFVKRLSPGLFPVFCGSGTSALLAAFFALELSPKAELLVPSNTFHATVTPLLQLNYVPVFCDCEPYLGLIDLADAESKLTSRTEAIVVTHLWGHPVNMNDAVTFAKKHGLALIEDCSHAHGVRYRGTPVGTFGQVSVFSLGTKKLVTGGVAGIAVTPDLQIYERLVAFTQPRPAALAKVSDVWLRAIIETGFGLNFRGSPISAILAADHLSRLDETISVKNRNLAALTEVILESLPEMVVPQKASFFSHGTWYSFNCQWPNEEIQLSMLTNALTSEGIRVRTHPQRLHRQPVFYERGILPQRTTRSAKFLMTSCPQTERFLSSTVSWDTAGFYQENQLIIEQYRFGLKKIRRNWAQIQARP